MLYWSFPHEIKFAIFPALLVILLFVLYIALKRASLKTILLFSIILLVLTLPYILALPIILYLSGLSALLQAFISDWPLILALLCFIVSVRGIIYAVG